MGTRMGTRMGPGHGNRAWEPGMGTGNEYQGIGIGTGNENGNMKPWEWGIGNEE